MNKEEKIEAAFREMANLAGGRMPENNDQANRRLTCRELDGLYLPKEADPEFSDQCHRYKWNPSMKNKARNPGNSLPRGIAFLFSCR